MLSESQHLSATCPILSRYIKPKPTKHHPIPLSNTQQYSLLGSEIQWHDFMAFRYLIAPLCVGVRSVCPYGSIIGGPYPHVAMIHITTRLGLQHDAVIALKENESPGSSSVLHDFQIILHLYKKRSIYLMFNTDWYLDSQLLLHCTLYL